MTVEQHGYQPARRETTASAEAEHDRLLMRRLLAAYEQSQAQNRELLETVHTLAQQIDLLQDSIEQLSGQPKKQVGQPQQELRPPISQSFR